MSQESRERGQDQPWQPTIEFYLSNPRSAQLREIGIAIVRKLDALLHDPEVAQNRDRQTQLYAELEIHGGQLIELGIKPNMHVGKPLEAFQSDPVVMAEYVTGQLYETTGHTVVSETAVMPIIQEMSEVQSGPAHVISGKNITPKLKDFMVMRCMVNVGYRFLNAEPEN
ncbi:MAG: hypothetical protein Q7R43_05155 [Candidatus Daviesbacteria bacterium]|nr:hypothetical protein [Candidatus Daviesbacteria bacterium]